MTDTLPVIVSAFFVGVLCGFIILALVTGNKDRDQDSRTLDFIEANRLGVFPAKGTSNWGVMSSDNLLLGSGETVRHAVDVTRERATAAEMAAMFRASE